MGPCFARISQWFIRWTSKASLMSNFAFILSRILHEGARAQFGAEIKETFTESKALGFSNPRTFLLTQGLLKSLNVDHQRLAVMKIRIHSSAVPADPLCGKPFETLRGVRVSPIETAK
jgi:hypothetical protein